MNVASGSRWEGNLLRALFLGFALAGDVAADSAPEVFRDLNKPREERNILPADINNRGWIVGTTVAFGFRATGFLMIDRFFQRFDRQPDDEFGRTSILGVDDKGVMVGTDISTSPPEYFTYADGEYTTISAPPHSPDFAVRRINTRGDFVATFTDRVVGSDDLSHGLLFTKVTRKFTLIDVPHSGLDVVSTIPHDINERGDIVGEYVDYAASGPVTHGFLRSAGGRYSTIDVPRATGTTPNGINNWGHIVGDYFGQGGSSDIHGFVLIAGRFTTIDLPYSDRTTISAINDSDDFVGTRLDPADIAVGYIANVFSFRPRP